jgi:hypothetical protein
MCLMVLMIGRWVDAHHEAEGFSKTGWKDRSNDRDILVT